MFEVRVSRRRALSALAALPVVVTASAALGAPRPGQPFPKFSATNLDGHDKSESDLRGKQTLVVVVTSPSAADRMSVWVRETQARFPDQVLRRVVFLAFDLAAIVPTFLVRDKARGKVPRRYWKDTFVDAHGDLAGQLGVVTGSDQPLVYLLDRDARVKAAVRGEMTTEHAARLWAAVDRPPSAAK